MPKYTVIHDERDGTRGMSVAVTDDLEMRLAIYEVGQDYIACYMDADAAENIGYAMIEGAQAIRNVYDVTDANVVLDMHGHPVAVARRG